MSPALLEVEDLSVHFASTAGVVRAVVLSIRSQPYIESAIAGCTKNAKLLWRKVKPKLSAGRVQSVAVRLIVERERDRMAFRSATWWDLIGHFATQAKEAFDAELALFHAMSVPVAAAPQVYRAGGLRALARRGLPPVRRTHF